LVVLVLLIPLMVMMVSFAKHKKMVLVKVQKK
jgi:hypothetical protein